MSIDIVDDVTPLRQYIAATAQTEFDYPFPIFSDADLTVSVGGVTKALASDYTVSGAGGDNGGTVTLTTPPGTGAIVTIYRDTAIERGSDYQQNGGLSSAALNDDLDKLIVIAQELEAKIGRALRIPRIANVASADIELPPANWANRYLSFDANGMPTPAALSAQTMTRAIIGQLIYPATTAELATGLTLDTRYEHGNVMRYGIVPNDAGQASANATRFAALTDPQVAGPIGWHYFPPVIGGDVYHFAGMSDWRPGFSAELHGCTLRFNKTYAAADNKHGFINLLRDSHIQGGRIEVDYDGTSGVNAGSVVRVGSRYDYAYGGYANGILDEDDDIKMGNITLRDLELVTNNPGSHIVLMLGGLDGVTVENVKLDGQSAAAAGILYEFGQASSNGHDRDDADNFDKWSTSHGRSLTFRNVSCRGLASGAALEITGGYSWIVENLSVDGGSQAFVFRPGEALFFRPWSRDAAGAKRCGILRNITGQNLTGTAIQLAGAERASGGYLNAAGLTASQQTDLMTFSLDGFAIKFAGATGTGVFVSGPCDIRNGTVDGGANPIVITDECVQFGIDNVKLLNGSDSGIRASFGDNIWDTARKKIGTIRNSHIAGNTGAGISLDRCESVLIENCRLGYSSAYDPGSETTQTSGVIASTGANGVVCRGNYVTTSGGAVAYNLIGEGDRGCDVWDARGTRTFTGPWKRDGIATASSSQLSLAIEVINALSKYTGKLVRDTSVNRLMVATGPAATDPWNIVDNSASVTPA